MAILSLTTITGFASMGYLFNDLFDIKKDALAGKRNFLAGKSSMLILLLFSVSAAFVFVPWIYLPKTNLSFILIGAQLLLFIVYSAPPVRLKERGLAGIVTDALYAHGLPPVLAAYTFWLASRSLFLSPDILLLFAWQTLAGVRNILLHQFDDITADKIAGSKNFVAGLPASTFHLLLKWLIVVELLLSIIFFGVILPSNSLFAICMLLIPALSATVFMLFREKNTGDFLNSSRKFFPNNIYEKWLPVAYLILLSAGDIRFVVLLIIHLVLFNFNFYIQLADKLYGRYKSVAFKGILIDIKVLLSYPVNYFIYYLLRIFGIDLKKENTSAAAYFQKKLGKK